MTMKRLAAVSLFVIAGVYGVARAQSTEVRCKDGTTSLAGSGACSEHGGVFGYDEWSGTKASPATSEALERKRAGAGTAPRVVCSDGTIATAGEGACAHNGGVERALSESTSQATRTRTSSFNPKAELKTPGRTPGTGNDTPTARCGDGSMSYAKHAADACYGHGGVSAWLVDDSQR
jgi:hypothetical protein